MIVDPRPAAILRTERGPTFTGLSALFASFFASIPYEWYTNNDIASYEGFYASVFYSYFAGLGLDVTVEDSSSHGRLDMALRFNRRPGHLQSTRLRSGSLTLPARARYYGPAAATSARAAATRNSTK